MFSFYLTNIFVMKKILATLVVAMGLVVAVHAQETKEKPVTTPGDKVHNTLHPKNKVQHGTKYKHETVSGKKSTSTVKSNKQEALEPKKKSDKKDK
jgi:hypothetical protein